MQALDEQQLPIMETGGVPIHQSMESLTLERKYSDMTISCQGHVFHVSRAMVCCQSDVLAREIDGHFRESGGALEHDMYDARALNRMIEYLYTGDYDKATKASFQVDTDLPGAEDGHANDNRTTTQSATANLLSHINVHGIAGYYNITKLQYLAAGKFQEALKDTPWPEIELFPIVEAIYEQPASQDKGLRDAIKRKALPHTDELNNDKLPGEFLLKLLHCLSTDRLQDKAKIIEDQTNIESMRTSLRIAYEQNDKARGELNTVVGLLQNLRGCRHCDSKFNVRAEKSGPNGKYYIRCIDCKTKHT